MIMHVFEEACTARRSLCLAINPMAWRDNDVCGERIARAFMSPFKNMLALCEVAWLACRAVCPLDEASGQHRGLHTRIAGVLAADTVGRSLVILGVKD